MRFRNLTNTELEALSEELVQFLVVQGIDDDLWREMNQKSPEKAIELVALFSDTVLEKVYSKVRYLSFISEQIFSVFKIDGGTMHAVVLKNKASNSAFKDLQHVIEISTSKTAVPYEVMSATRELDEKILDEIHRLTEQGCLVADQELWMHFERYHKNEVN